MVKWVRLTLIPLSVEGILLLAVAYLLLWKPEFLELHRIASGVVCAIAGVGLLMPALIGLISGISSKMENPHEKKKRTHSAGGYAKKDIRS